MNLGNLGTAQYYSTMAQDNTNAQNLKVQELQNQQQEYQMGQMKMQADKQKMAQQEQQQKFQTSEMAKLASSLESGGTEQQQAAIWSKAKTDALKSGYVDLAKQYGEEEQSLLKTSQEKQKLQKQEGIDDKSSAYTAYETALLSRKPEDILASQVAAQKAGLPIPKFGDKSQEESQRKIYMANVEGVKAEQDQEERIRKDKADEVERERSHKAEEELKRQKDAEIAVSREQNKIQRDMLNQGSLEAQNIRKSEAIEKFNKDLAKDATPYLKDRENLETVKNIIKQDSAPSDQQLHQMLPGIFQGFKNRATTAYYKDNKYFGDIVNKIESFGARAFEGRYSEDDRKNIMDMVMYMEKNVTDPALKSLKGKYQDRVRKFAPDDTDSIDLPVDLPGSYSSSSGQRSSGTIKGAAVPVTNW